MIKERIKSYLNKINNEKLNVYIETLTNNTLDSFEIALKKKMPVVKKFIEESVSEIPASKLKYVKLLMEYLNMIDLGLLSFVEKLKLDKTINESNITFSYFLESLSNKYINQFPDFVLFENFYNLIKNYAISPSIERYYNDFKVIYESKKQKVKLFEYFNKIFLSEVSPITQIVSENELNTIENFILLGEGSKKEVIFILEKYSYFVPVKEFISILTNNDDLISSISSGYDADNFEIYKEVPSLLKEYKDGLIFNINGNLLFTNGKTLSLVDKQEMKKLDEDYVILSDYLKDRILNLNENILQFKGSNNRKITFLKNNNEVSIYIGQLNEDFGTKYDYSDLSTIITITGNIFEGLTKNNAYLLKYLRDAFLNGDIENIDNVVLVKNKINESKSFFIIKVNNSYNFLVENELIKNKSISLVRKQLLETYGFDIGTILKESISKEELILEELNKIKQEHLEKIQNLEKRLNLLESKKEYFEKMGLINEYKELVYEIEDLLLKLKRDGTLQEVEDMISEIKFNGIQDELENTIKIGDIVRYKNKIGKVVESYGDTFLVNLENGDKIVKHFLFLDKITDISKLDEASFSFIVGNKKVTIEDIDDSSKSQKEETKETKKEKESEEKSEKKSKEESKEESEKETEEKSEEEKETKEEDEEENLDDLLKL